MAGRDEIEMPERRFLAALGLVADHVRCGVSLVMTDADERAIAHQVETRE